MVRSPHFHSPILGSFLHVFFHHRQLLNLFVFFRRDNGALLSPPSSPLEKKSYLYHPPRLELVSLKSTVLCPFEGTLPDESRAASTFLLPLLGWESSLEAWVPLDGHGFGLRDFVSPAFPWSPVGLMRFLSLSSSLCSSVSTFLFDPALEICLSVRFIQTQAYDGPS